MDGRNALERVEEAVVVVDSVVADLEVAGLEEVGRAAAVTVTAEMAAAGTVVVDVAVVAREEVEMEAVAAVVVETEEADVVVVERAEAATVEVAPTLPTFVAQSVLKDASMQRSDAKLSAKVEERAEPVRVASV